MRWPWVSRTAYERIERELEEQHRRIDALMAAAVESMDEAKAERRALLDRIVQLSGQAPLYKAPAAAVEAAAPAEKPAPTSNLPPPRAVVTFADIHATTREAMQKPNFRADRGVIH